MNHRELDHSPSLFGVALIISDQTSGEGKPCKGSLNNPSFGQDDEFAGIGTFDDLDYPAKYLGSPNDQFSRVATICEDMLDRGDQGKQANQQRPRADTILNSGRMDNHCEDEPHRIYRDVLLAALDLFAGIKTARPPFPAVFTERESIMATEGCAFFPILERAFLRKVFMAGSHVPPKRQCRNKSYTVCQGGNSLGKKRHWRPVFTTYSIPLISPQNFCSGGRPRRGCVGSGFTTNGASNSHCAYVKSLGYIIGSSQITDDFQQLQCHANF